MTTAVCQTAHVITVVGEALVDLLKLRGLELPVLLRFNGILRDRLREIHDTFKTAISEYGYQGSYTCVYPIKVNQQKHVVEKVVEYGREFGFGLEAGSKPELLAVVALTDPDVPIVCNGFKDRAYIETVRARTAGLPTTLFVLAGEEIVFREVLLRVD